MNHTPEQDLQPRDATIVNEPDPDEEREANIIATVNESYFGDNWIINTPTGDAMAVNIIDTDVLQVGVLSERIQLALNEYHTENGDIEIMALLLEECLIDRNDSQQMLNGLSNDIQLLINDMIKQNNIAKEAF